MQVAIDGPAGSGKSSVCKIIAEKYGFTYIDTGAMYRSVAWVSVHFGEDNLVEKISNIDFILEENGKKISIKYDGKIYDLTKEIRTPEISSKVALVASNGEIRKILVKKQQEFAKSGDVIMEGRDITTVVLPYADIKIFLTASPEERAKRRFKEWQSEENKQEYEKVLSEIKKRDEIDSTRKESPLMQAKDAILLDTTGLTLEQVADKIGEMIAEKKEKSKK
ncbi:MAG TPA: (d)CMP kinase [Candidatus Mucispirillum faecigallinarum]|uniref:Cytidylate kinase n=1 Tax=Candidatus Mucispirillum faecigallinarum TaxID=2838699 RepID=A0A9D2GT88_9BACT|nr:(d)CMP kinase [Candidatus Mucispirillum faecigallinarum]